VADAGDEPLLRHVRTRVRSPQTNGVIERFFGTLKYEHLYRDIDNRIRPHQALDERTPRQACAAPMPVEFTCETARAASGGVLGHGRLPGSYEELVAAR
jgi:hypothetical protein